MDSVIMLRELQQFDKKAQHNRPERRRVDLVAGLQGREQVK